MKLSLFIAVLGQIDLHNTFPVLSFWQNDTKVILFCVQPVLQRQYTLPLGHTLYFLTLLVRLTL